jgi:hypothetical protein
MRWFAIVLTIIFSAIAVMGQGVGQMAPVFYGFSNSVIDHNGRLLIFDASYLYPSPPVKTVQPMPVWFPPTVRTRVTVIDSDASNKRDAQYDGTFQVIGAGRYAVYAIITNYAVVATPVQSPTSMTRQLVALGPLFPTLPSVDVPLQTDVKMSAVGDNGELDTITLVDHVVRPLMGASTGTVLPVPPIPAEPRTVQMFRSDGKSFKALPPVALSNP